MTADNTYYDDIDARIDELSQREPLMFDPESAHGVAALTAVAVLEHEFEQRIASWPLDQQTLQVEFVLEAVQQYLAQLRQPDCPQCGAALTGVTRDRFGRANWCPTCAKGVGR